MYFSDIWSNYLKKKNQGSNKQKIPSSSYFWRKECEKMERKEQSTQDHARVGNVPRLGGGFS